MASSPHDTHQVTTRHRTSRVQCLLVADEQRLAELEAMIATLPLCAAGRVFIETDGGGEPPALPVPSRMTVTWLDRSRRGGTPGTGTRCAPGEAARRAASAWATEMLCGDADASAWIGLGFSASAELRELLVDELGVPAEAVVTPAAFGLDAR